MTSPLQLPPVLEPLRNTIESVLAPCILLMPDKDASVRTHVDGKPRLAPGSAWPEGPDGPLGFVGQIDFAEAAEAGGVELGLPDRGLLAMFCDQEEFWTGESPDDRQRFHVAYTPDTAQTVELEPPGELYAKSALPQVLRRGVSLPDFFDRALENYESLQSGKRLDAYSDLCRNLIVAQHGKYEGDHRLRGHAAWGEQDGRLTAQLASNGVDAKQRDDPRQKALAPGAAAWNLLLQVDKYGIPSSTDVGAFHLVIRDEDLAARAFDRAWVVNLIA